MALDHQGAGLSLADEVEVLARAVVQADLVSDCHFARTAGCCSGCFFEMLLGECSAAFSAGDQGPASYL